MSASGSTESQEELVRSLTERASTLWGRERAEEIRGIIGETAVAIWRISQDLPSDDEEPAFYL